MDATRFMLLFRRNDAPLDFDFAVVKEQTRDNPVFYVQYAHARTWSIFRNAARDLPGLDILGVALKEADLSLLPRPRNSISSGWWGHGRARWRRRRGRMSRIGWPFTCMNLPRNFTPSGPRARKTPHYGLLTTMPPH